MALESISFVGEVLASKNVSATSGGLEWMVTFMNNAGDLPLLVADNSAMWGGVTVGVVEERTGTSKAVSGSFELAVSEDGSKSETISHDASAAEVNTSVQVLGIMLHYNVETYSTGNQGYQKNPQKPHPHETYSSQGGTIVRASKGKNTKHHLLNLYVVQKYHPFDLIVHSAAIYHEAAGFW